ncbi:hypothetical protein OH76DRAFT_1423889 [Lentinus brumalis]|uniref:Uncharacterized protein n=1 Tax=Lentinus brumalis TaxID=2498619 RepID=A0A371CIP3_9APHY|nr:hypothetical protein OH76DRAFT_1423889 [Polyporus brumalis]
MLHEHEHDALVRGLGEDDHATPRYFKSLGKKQRNLTSVWCTVVTTAEERDAKISKASNHLETVSIDVIIIGASTQSQDLGAFGFRANVLYFTVILCIMAAFGLAIFMTDAEFLMGDESEVLEAEYYD